MPVQLNLPSRAHWQAWDTYRWTNALLANIFDGKDPSASAGESGHGPLSGLTFSVKDLFQTAGMTTTAGSLLFRDHVPAVDATVVTRLKEAGALLVGKGHCAEFGFGMDTETRLGGRVLHPWRPELSVGGSSGGDATATATGMVDFAVATDYGGSVRWPAQALGIFGLRTSVGVVPRSGCSPWSTSPGALGAPFMGTMAGQLMTAGIFARSAGMIEKVVGVLSGSDGVDWLGLDVELASESREPSVIRVALSAGEEAGPVTKDVRDALAAVGHTLRTREIETVDPGPILTDAYEAYRGLRTFGDRHEWLKDVVAGRESLLCTETNSVLSSTSQMEPGGGVGDLWSRALVARSRIRRSFEAFDALVVPVAMSGPRGFGEGIRLDGRHYTSHELVAQSRAITLSGCPSMSVPVHKTDDGVVVSVQVVAAPGRDRACCRLAELIALKEGYVRLSEERPTS
jgi:amidase